MTIKRVVFDEASGIVYVDRDQEGTESFNIADTVIAERDVNNQFVNFRLPSGQVIAGGGGAGQNAFTTTTAVFTQPAANANVTITVVASGFLAVGQPIYIQNGGFYEVVSKPNATSVVIKNLGYSVNTAPAATVATASQIVPSGIKGVDGGGGSSTVVLSVSRSVSNTDNNATLIYSGASDIVLTIPSGLTSAFSCTVVQNGSGRVSFVQGGGVGFDNVGTTRGSGTFTTVVQVAANQYGFQNPVPNAPVTLIQSGIPFVSLSSWVFVANGALTLSVGLPASFPAAYLYFPADAIGAGVPAGWYYTTFSNTTTGTVFNNRYVSGQPVIPSAPTAFSTMAGTVTAQVTTAIPAITTTVPGGALGPNGRIEVQALWQGNNSAAIKAFTTQYGGQNLLSTSVSGSNIVSEVETKALNTGLVTRQVTRFATINSQTGTPSYTTVDSSQDQTLNVTHTLSTAAMGDYLICLRFSATALYWN